MRYTNRNFAVRKSLAILSDQVLILSNRKMMKLLTFLKDSALILLGTLAG